MPFIEWNERFSVQIPQIDEHHRHLFFLLNKTYDDFVERSSNQPLEKLLDELIDYATYHFSIEEQWMQKTFFPGFEKHKNEHDRFSQEVEEIANDLKNNKKVLSLEILSFLNNWLCSHILKSDVEFGHFFMFKDNSSHKQ